jgi:hypothetical protein
MGKEKKWIAKTECVKAAERIRLKSRIARLQEKAEELQDYSNYDYCYCPETCTCRGSTTEGMHRAGDDLEWILRAFGLERK